jgi:hypothetical protein
MHKWLPVLVFLATASVLSLGSMAVDLPLAADVSGAGSTIVLVGGMGGGTAGGMGGGTAGGMGGGTAGGMGGAMGGMTGGGMGGMTPGGMSGGMGGMSGGMSGFGAAPGNSSGSIYGGADPSGGAAQPAQYYLCVTPYDRCSLASSPGSVRSGSACTCSTGHRGTIK